MAQTRSPQPPGVRAEGCHIGALAMVHFFDEMAFEMF